MFWKFNQATLQDTVLFKEDTTLEEVLDQENVLQELKSQNKKLVDFITRADIISQLVGLVISEPPPELDEAEKYRRPNLACEVLTTDIPIVNERLSDKALLTKLYSFLERESPLNPLLASFFSRTLSMLICRKADQNWYSYQFTCLQFLDFLKTKENSLDLLLKHLDTSAIMDLTLKLITQIEGSEMQNNLIDWIESEGLIENIVALFEPKVDEGRHHNAAQLLCDTVRKCRELSNDYDPILNSIQSTETIQKLLSQILTGEHVESSIVGGISVLLTLLESPSSEPVPRRGAYSSSAEDSGSGEPPPSPNPAVQSIVSAIIPFLPALHDLLLNPPKKPAVKLACGTIEPPLGNTRLSVVKLIAALIATNSREVNAELDRLNTVQVLLDLFFRYTWNNFLHSQVDRCLALALNSTDPDSLKENPLIHCIFIKCRLLQRILEAWEENETEQSKAGGKRRGYMGHLTNIANSVIKQGDCLLDFINDSLDETTRQSWSNYVKTTLLPINELHRKFLGGSHPAHSSSKSEDDFNDVSFPGESSLNQSFNDFDASSGLTSDFIEDFAFDFSRDANTSSLGGDSSSRKERGEEAARKELFLAICSQKKAFADLEAGMDDEDVWEERADNLWNNSDDFSSSSDEDNEKVSPKSVKEMPESAALVEPANPWAGAEEAESGERQDGTENETTPPTDEGWADFSAFDQQFAQSDLLLPQSSSSSEEEAGVAGLLGKSSASGMNEAPSVVEDTPECSDSSGSQTTGLKSSSEEGVQLSHSKLSNLNDLVLEDVPDEELVDNFRFLSIQGLISDKKTSPSKTEEVREGKKVEVKQEDTKVGGAGGRSKEAEAAQEAAELHPGDGTTPTLHPGDGITPPLLPRDGTTLPLHPGDGTTPPLHPGDGTTPPLHPGDGTTTTPPPLHPQQPDPV